MNARDIEITKAMLDVAHDADGHQYFESVLHAATNCRLQAVGKAAATLGEFNACLDIIGQRGWMTRVINKSTGRMKWNLNDAGEAARLEM